MVQRTFLTAQLAGRSEDFTGKRAATAHLFVRVGGMALNSITKDTLSAGLQVVHSLVVKLNKAADNDRPAQAQLKFNISMQARHSVLILWPPDFHNERGA